MGVEETLRSVAFALVRFSSFAANALLFGLVPILWLVVRPALAPLTTPEWAAGRRAVAERFEGLGQAAIVASAVTAAVGLLLQVALFAGLQGGNVGTDALEAVLQTPFGRWYALRLPLLIALTVLLVGRIRTWSLAEPGEERSHRLWWAVWAGLALMLLATSTFSGHAAVAQPRALALVNDIVHLAAGGIWFTGIVVLAIALPDAWKRKGSLDRLRVLAPSVMRFSGVALTTITVLLVTGTINSFLHLAAWDDLIDTTYGRTLGIKILFYVGILGLGGTNHFFLRDRMQRALEHEEPAGAQRLFRKTIAAELAIALVILGTTGALTGLSRTRQQAPAPPPASTTP